MDCLAFHLESNGRRMLFWGDCAHHEVASLDHPEWHALVDMDKTQGAATRKRIYGMAADERLLVMGYHTSFPVARLRAAGGGGVSLVAADVSAPGLRHTRETGGLPA